MNALQIFKKTFFLDRVAKGLALKGGSVPAQGDRPVPEEKTPIPRRFRGLHALPPI